MRETVGDTYAGWTHKTPSLVSIRDALDGNDPRRVVRGHVDFDPNLTADEGKFRFEFGDDFVDGFELEVGLLESGEDFPKKWKDGLRKSKKKRKHS